MALFGLLPNMSRDYVSCPGDYQHSLSNGQERGFPNKNLKSRARKQLRKAIGNILPCRHIFHTYHSLLNRLMNEVMSDIDVFGACVEFVILCYHNHSSAKQLS